MALNSQQIDLDDASIQKVFGCIDMKLYGWRCCLSVIALTSSLSLFIPLVADAQHGRGVLAWAEVIRAQLRAMRQWYRKAPTTSETWRFQDRYYALSEAGAHLIAGYKTDWTRVGLGDIRERRHEVQRAKGQLIDELEELINDVTRYEAKHGRVFSVPSKSEFTALRRLSALSEKLPRRSTHSVKDRWQREDGKRNKERLVPLLENEVRTLKDFQGAADLVSFGFLYAFHSALRALRLHGIR